MNVIRIIKKTKGKIDQAKVIINIFCMLNEISLSDTELTVIAYYLVYMDNKEVKDLILKGKILKSEDSLKNTISKLKRIGLLKKSQVNKDYEVHERLKFTLEPVIGFLIKIDNS